MGKIEIYTKNFCPYCHRAKELLKIKGVNFTEYDVSQDPAKEAEMLQRSGRSTVPEIFINDQLIGGCDELFSLDEKGALDPLIA